MHKIIITIFTLLTLMPMTVFADEIVAVMDAPRPSYLKALEGFTKACKYSPAQNQGIKTIHNTVIHQVVLNNQNANENYARIRELRPDLILAIGNHGLEAAIQFEDLPIVYLLVSNPAQIIGQRNNVTGIELKIPAEIQLKAMRKQLPKLKKLGVIYDPRHTGNLIEEAKAAAPTIAVSMVAQPMTNRNYLSELLNDMAKNKIDAFWMVPDITVLSVATIQDIMLFSMEHKIPVITFADKYLQQGASVSITFDLWAIGAQAGTIAQSILDGAPVSSIPQQTIEQATVKRNVRIMEKMGVTFNKNAQ